LEGKEKGAAIAHGTTNRAWPSPPPRPLACQLPATAWPSATPTAASACRSSPARPGGKLWGLADGDCGRVVRPPVAAPLLLQIRHRGTVGYGSRRLGPSRADARHPWRGSIPTRPAQLLPTRPRRPGVITSPLKTGARRVSAPHWPRFAAAVSWAHPWKQESRDGIRCKAFGRPIAERHVLTSLHSGNAPTPHRRTVFERDTAASPRAGALGNRRSGFCSCGHGAGARSPSDSPSSALGLAATPRRHRGGPPASPVRDTGGRRTLVRICCWRGVAVSGVGGVPAHFPALPAHAPHHVPPPVLSSLRFERVATSPPSLLPICLLFSPVRPPPYPLCP